MTHAGGPGPDRTGERAPPGRVIDTVGRNVPTTRAGRTHSTPKIASSRLVAAALGAEWTPTEINRWLTAVIRGQDPDAKIDPKARGTGTTPPDWHMRRWAFQTMLERQLGKVKAHVVLENTGGPLVQADVKIATFALDARDLDLALPGGELDAFRKMQAQLVQRAKAKVAALTAKVVDATSTE